MHNFFNHVKKNLGLWENQNFVSFLFELFQELKEKINFWRALIPLVKVIKFKLFLNYFQSFSQNIIKASAFILSETIVSVAQYGESCLEILILRL